MKLPDTELKSIFDLSLDNHTAFFVDWKSPVEDIVFNIKSLLPKLPIEALPEKQISGDWIEPIILANQEYDFKTESPTLILDVMSTVNKYLATQNLCFLWYDSQDDLYQFLLVNSKDVSDYLEKGFKEI